jgi:branched-chain amino acid transport system permease protein
MSQLLMPILNGITYGALLFMCASGFTLVFGLMRIVNLSHGMFYLLGAYIGLSVFRSTQNWIFALMGGAISVAVIAAVIQFSLLRRVQGFDLRETLLTLGISFILADVLLAIYGGMPQNIKTPDLIGHPVNLGLLYYPGFRLFVLFVAILQGMGLWLLISRTRIGQIIRAGVDDRPMVSALGININRVFTIVFMLTGLLAGLSGVLGGSYLAFATGTDLNILVYSLVVVILGGMGSVGGAALGAVTVGLIDSLAKTYMPQMTMVFVFGSLMLVLAFRPYGFLGKER